jgi:hypothetical protein
MLQVSIGCQALAHRFQQRWIDNLPYTLTLLRLAHKVAGGVCWGGANFYAWGYSN